MNNDESHKVIRTVNVDPIKEVTYIQKCCIDGTYNVYTPPQSNKWLDWRKVNLAVATQME